MFIETKKTHISRLPVRAFPQLPVVQETSSITISIPLFQAVTDTATYSTYSKERFQQVHAKGAVWTAIGLIQNTDLLQKGAQLMFHIEDAVWDDALEVFEAFAVPPELCHKRTIQAEDAGLGQPHFGKKYMCLFEECPSETWMLVDSDMLFCTPTQPMQIHDKIVAVEDQNWVAYTFLGGYHEENYGKYVKGACVGAGFAYDETLDDYTQENQAAFTLGLPAPPETYYRPYPCTMAMVVKPESEMAAFIRQNCLHSYQDEFMLSQWMAENARHTEQEADWGIGDLCKYLEIPIFNFETEYVDREHGLCENGYIAHLHPDGHQGDMKHTDTFFKDLYFDLERPCALPVPVEETPVAVPLPFKLRFHILAPAYATLGESNYVCAFTQKVKDFAEMMSDLGCECIVYAGEGSVCEDAEVVEVVDQRTLQETYESWSGLQDGQPDYKSADATGAGGDRVHRNFTTNALIELDKRVRPHDFILPFYGWGHKTICDNYQDTEHVHVVEAGIGYPTCIGTNRIYESSAKMHFDRGRRATTDSQHQWEYHASNAYDFRSTVVPNYFKPSDYVTSQERQEADTAPYVMFLGRISQVKGLYEAIAYTEKAGIRLYLAGEDKEGLAAGFPEHCRYLGIINKAERAYYLTYADATLCWSHYPEPFCGVHIQSMMCRTPVITSNQGVFLETVRNGYNGYRCQWPADIEIALRNIHKIDPENCYATAMNYSTDLIALRYFYYFQGFLRNLTAADPMTWHDDEFMPSLDWLHEYDKETVERERVSIQKRIAECP